MAIELDREESGTEDKGKDIATKTCIIVTR